MIRPRTFDKTILSILSIVTGILLFLSSFVFMLNNIFFNSEFQKEAVSKLGIGGYVIHLADEMSSEDVLLQNETVPAFGDIVTSDLINRNVQSLIDGLIQYFKGNTNTLPDIHLPDFTDCAGVARGFDINEGYPERINLNGLLMMLGEPRIADIMLVINLFQFILSQIPYLCLFIMIMFCTMMFHKSAAPVEICVRIQFTVAVYSILCVSSGFLIQLLLYLQPLNYLSFDYIPEFVSGRVLTGYITYCANSLSVQLIFSGIILFGGVYAAILFLKRSNQKSLSHPSLVICYSKPVFQRATSSYIKHTGLSTQKFAVTALLIITLLTIGFHLQVHLMFQNFSDRNLSRAVAFINGTDPCYQVIDARDDQVYLLHVKVSDKMSGQPVEGLTIRVSNRDKNNYEYIEYCTDAEGSAIFSLGQDGFKLMLYPDRPTSANNLPQWLSYDFEMTKPGMEELQVVLDVHDDGSVYIQETFMQYIP